MCVFPHFEYDVQNLVGSTQASADHEQSYSFSDDEVGLSLLSIAS